MDRDGDLSHGLTLQNFFDAVDLPIPSSAEGHPVLAGKTGSLSWVNDATILQTIGKRFHFCGGFCC